MKERGLKNKQNKLGLRLDFISIFHENLCINMHACFITSPSIYNSCVHMRNLYLLVIV